MSGWGEALAALAGAGEGELGREERDAARKQQLELAQSKGVVAQVIQQMKTDGLIRVADTNQAGANTRAGMKDATTQRGQDLANDLGWGKLSSQDSNAAMHDDTVRRGQDLTEGRFWGGTLPFQYTGLQTNDATRRRGQDVSAAASNYRADSAAGASTYRTDTAAAESAANRRGRNVFAALGLMSKQKPDIFGTGANSKDWADEADKLWNDPDYLASTLAGGASDQAPVAVPPSAGAAPAPSAAAPPSVAPKQQAPAAPKAPGGLVVGATVTLKGGKKVTVTKVNPDGTFEYK